MTFMSKLFKPGQARNDFDVSLTDKNWSSDWEETFAAQVVKLEINLVRNEVVVWVRQLRAGVIQDMIFNLLTRETPFDKLHLKPVKSKKGGAEYAFVNGRMVDHQAEFSYLSQEVIQHKLTLQFENVKLKSPTGQMDLVHYVLRETKVDFDVTKS